MRIIKRFNEHVIDDDKYKSKPHPKSAEIQSNIEDILVSITDLGKCSFEVNECVIDYVNKDNIVDIKLKFHERNISEEEMDEIYEDVVSRLEKFGYKRDALYRKGVQQREYDFILVVNNKYKI